jgi:uncharacterized HAD superfamily protein
MIKQHQISRGVLVDLDGTLTELGHVEAYAKFLGLPIPQREDVHIYNLEEMFGATQEQSREFWSGHDSASYRDATPQSDSVRVLRQLYSSNISLKYVTARGSKDREISRQWLMAHGYPTGELTVGAGDKAAHVMRMGLGLAIEDAPQNALAVARIGVPVILIDWPYNRYVDHPLVHRAHTWSDVEQYLFHRKERIA